MKTQKQKGLENFRGGKHVEMLAGRRAREGVDVLHPHTPMHPSHPLFPSRILYNKPVNASRALPQVL